MNQKALKSFLDYKSQFYNTPEFIGDDPIAIPRSFLKKQDIEITGLFAAVMAWGQRKTIIYKCRQLIDKMDGSPYDFILNHQEKDLARFKDFKHRTFQPSDILYFIHFLHHYYSRNNSLEKVFKDTVSSGDETLENGLRAFHNLFCSLDSLPERTKKHIATPAKKSSCKRLNMFLRWMVRKDDRGVDFGIWEKISENQLLCPLDVHVARVARQLGLITRKQTDWQATLELTRALKNFDPQDPVKYDFALFGLGIIENFQNLPSTD